MRTDDFDYELEEERIAQVPIKERDHSKLLILDRDTGKIKHEHFYNIVDYINPGDVLVLNNTKVLPARLFGSREGKNEKIEVLLLKREADVWECLVRPGKKMKVGTEIIFGEGILRGKVLHILEDGTRKIEFYYTGIFEEILDQLGQMPLPPYIKEELEDKDRYQTVYAKESGSAAAPTAGLHFTKELMKKINEKGGAIAYITLHVGLGTFRPVSVEDVADHKMHSEYYSLDEENLRIIEEAKKKGGQLIAVGTTTIRTLETIGEKFSGSLQVDSGWTDIFIYPGFEFKIADSLITNFHLPKSTLLMLVSAFSSKENIMNAYEEAKNKDYLFFSFGDGMFIRKENICLNLK
ncbi:MAG: tRNA preQ1(34) S-adenosylmethionine ribosyltransferase-isomerase QueA [Gallicola sp.]|nr:tRNA preQ1(34) S-adenosylmethionine ribosyltransferase-isomerase QueA [Gallicola sp.]